ncbi:unnamed protein product [Parnassius apollo]|uniref:(apollo) hypothetical protein n=1 Tax=Parnassius apollo TaxID=110799 RepID=A0A8S3Y4Z7_PARAO|nr:unnamed protein product [Parnassius apollo]
MHEELGDRRPSQFLRHLQHLAGPNVPDDFIRTIWSSRLPNNLQTVIASQPDSTLKALADLADKVHDLVPTVPQVVSTNAISVAVTDKITQQIAELTRQVQALSVRDSRSRSRSRNRYSRIQRKNSRSRRSQYNYKKNPICFCHHKYGDKAKVCLNPCDYKQGNSQGSR